MSHPAHTQPVQHRPGRRHLPRVRRDLRPLMLVGVAPRSLILLHWSPPARGRIPTPERLFRTVPTPKSAPGQCSHTEVQRAIRPTSLDFGKRVGWLSGEGGLKKVRWSPLPCSAAPCWETSLMMLSQSLGSRLREKTPHSRMFKKIVRREAGGRNVSGSGVQFACRSALGDHQMCPTSLEDAPLLTQFPTSKREFPLQLQFPTPQTNAPHRNDNCPHQSGVAEYSPLP